MPPHVTEDYRRAGARLIAARVLRHRRWRTRRAFAADIDVSYRTIADIERGQLGKRHGWDPGTIALIEHAVGWAPGSYESVLHGGEPTALDDDAARQLPDEITVRTQAVLDNPNLTDEMREAILSVLAESAQTYESGIRPARRRSGTA